MWSCRLNKKSSDLTTSITNSKRLAHTQAAETVVSASDKTQFTYFFTKNTRWQHLIELFIASNILAMLLSLAEARGWGNLSGLRLLEYALYINWVLLSFVACFEKIQPKLKHFSLSQNLITGFFLLQALVVITTISINFLMYWGSYWQLEHFSIGILFEGLSLHLSYGVLLGLFCFRYVFLREQWSRQQQSELKARIQALQARIQPHFLFNSLNNVLSLISIDPDKAEQMLMDLSRLFRASLQELKLVSLNDEIELCRRYLAIEKVRLGERLNIEWKFVHLERAREVKIPLLTLQPLLENSIAHGVEKIIQPSQITILIEILDNQVNIIISNPYLADDLSTTRGNGIALDNVKQRLQAYFGEKVTFQSYAGDGIFTTVVQYLYK
ncbi:sensor histidine kinase [Acinetobacter sp.]|uniref:sensor histidine kinase n=1 Tax=Acinetobacter sp. TaxID=472 RepID=UPI003890849E